MVKISVLYPHEGGSGFDMNYYLNNHIPMVRQKLGAACKGVAVEQGLAGAMPGSQPTYSAMGHLLFDSIESFQAAFGPHARQSWPIFPIIRPSNRSFKSATSNCRSAISASASSGKPFGIDLFLLGQSKEPGSEDSYRTRRGRCQFACARVWNTKWDANSI